MPEHEDQLIIRTDGSADELFGLLEWFNDDDELRGRVSMPTTPIRPGQMGDLAEVLVVALGVQGIVSALIQSLTTWFTHRRSDIAVTLTLDHTELTLDAKRVKTPEITQALQTLLDQANKPQ
ncbi:MULTISPECIES: effector-associated constant component EACC1 [Nocardia]|uniref:effector-associated constant component EACC1 n=1 Tax=Nocardia TaxID=1817 RepID=UPI000BF0602C|nr:MULTISPECIES: hypothetical protein [Nocardia]MBF6184869.1 hypothetical protein [Nocardia farcinica]MBF6310713.1 hypothetical protein [Nocardia farcinica]MBF6405467.1 hypothetical protein [Nocardia farcinica]PEH75150.1 hypothetical protein CRM89_03430 [Nocardia sp. FDAARGOS_372]UEX24694.1 hypothetical protein LMJ57_09685 [Nocardia farcinica]